VRLGIADHLGWAVAGTASADYEVIDRRRIELIEPDVTAAPIHYDGRRHDVAGMAELVKEVRASVVRATSTALDGIAATLAEPVVSISLRTWPPNFPEDMLFSFARRMRPARTRSCIARCSPTSQTFVVGESTSTTPNGWKHRRP
jgi:hypothetical protein